MYDDYIMERVRKHYDYLQSLGLNVVAIFAQGSMNYGLFINDEDYHSDVDTKAIILPTLDNLVCGNKMVSTKYELDGEQIDVKDIRVMEDMWAKSNPAYLEILFTKYKIINPIYESFVNRILEMGNDIVKMNFPQLAKCMSGMSKEKVIALEHPYPSLIDKIERYGYDPKQLHHIIRLNRLINEVFCWDIPFGEALEINDERVKKYFINIKKGCWELEKARFLAKDYDDDTRKIKEQVLEQYKDFEFDSVTYNKLKNIVNECVKFNIVNQIKGNNKRYMVMMQDEWNNLYYLGEYQCLADSIDDINSFLEVYDVSITAEDLKEYPSTFGGAFDLDIGMMYEDRDDLVGIMVRGFILE